jgi:hypothetical protein
VDSSGLLLYYDNIFNTFIKEFNQFFYKFQKFQIIINILWKMS